jgi:hypothetical protein
MSEIRLLNEQNDKLQKAFNRLFADLSKEKVDYAQLDQSLQQQNRNVLFANQERDNHAREIVDLKCSLEKANRNASEAVSKYIAEQERIKESRKKQRR